MRAGIAKIKKLKKKKWKMKNENSKILEKKIIKINSKKEGITILCWENSARPGIWKESWKKKRKRKRKRKKEKGSSEGIGKKKKKRKKEENKWCGKKSRKEDGARRRGRGRQRWERGGPPISFLVVFFFFWLIKRKKVKEKNGAGKNFWKTAGKSWSSVIFSPQAPHHGKKGMRHVWWCHFLGARGAYCWEILILIFSYWAEKKMAFPRKNACMFFLLLPLFRACRAF